MAAKMTLESASTATLHRPLRLQQKPRSGAVRGCRRAGRFLLFHLPAAGRPASHGGAGQIRS